MENDEALDRVIVFVERMSAPRRVICGVFGAKHSHSCLPNEICV